MSTIAGSLFCKGYKNQTTQNVLEILALRDALGLQVYAE